MKTLIAKFKICARLDQDPPCGPAGNRRPAVSPELQPFDAAVRDLDARLRASRPATPAPAGLHASIMRAVRAAAATPQPSRPALLPRLALVSASALVLAAGVWWSTNWLGQPVAPPDELLLETAAGALEQGQQWTTRAPKAAIAPLTREWELVQADVRAAVEFLLASVP